MIVSLQIIASHIYTYCIKSMYTGKKEVQDQPVVVVDNLYPMVRDRERQRERRGDSRKSGGKMEVIYDSVQQPARPAPFILLIIIIGEFWSYREPRSHASN